jgi:hypothetical protein
MRISHGPDVPIRRLTDSQDIADFLSSYRNGVTNLIVN